MLELQFWCSLVDQIDFTLSSYPPDVDHVYIDSDTHENKGSSHALNTSVQSDEDSLDFLFV